MDNGFIQVETWQGNIMVSSALLPPSTEEKMRIYPDRRDASAESLAVSLDLRLRAELAALGDYASQSSPEISPSALDGWGHEQNWDALSEIDAAYFFPETFPVTGTDRRISYSLPGAHSVRTAGSHATETEGFWAPDQFSPSPPPNEASGDAWDPMDSVDPDFMGASAMASPPLTSTQLHGIPLSQSSSDPSWAELPPTFFNSSARGLFPSARSQDLDSRVGGTGGPHGSLAAI